ncbi:MAG: DUF3618 domain-containing protein [Gemmatimonadaceae bacterium]
MAETTADVRRDIEMTRERMSDTLAQLEQKMNVMQIVKDHPWPALALALGAGFALAGSHADVKAAAATVRATGGASSKLGSVLDDLAANVIGSVSAAFQDRVDGIVHEIKDAIGAPTAGARAPAFAGSAAVGATRPGAVSRTDDGASAAQSAVNRPDRQVLGMEEGARRSTSGQLLGIDLPAQDSGAVGARDVEGIGTRS